MPSLPAESFRLCAARRAAQHDPYPRRPVFAFDARLAWVVALAVFVASCLWSFLAGRGAAC